jgi:hypothetical protein
MAGEWEIKIKKDAKIVIQHDDNGDMVIEIVGDKPVITGIGKRLLVRLDNVVVVEIWNPKRFSERCFNEKEELTKERAENCFFEYGIVESCIATRKNFEIIVDCKNLSLANELRKKKSFVSTRSGSNDVRHIKILDVLDADARPKRDD